MAEELPWPGELAVIEAYGDLSTSLIKKVGEAAEKAFYALPDYRGAGQRQQYVGEYENILFGARLEAARLAIGFHQEVARVNGKKYRPPTLKKRISSQMVCAARWICWAVQVGSSRTRLDRSAKFTRCSLRAAQ